MSEPTMSLFEFDKQNKFLFNYTFYLEICLVIWNLEEVIIWNWNQGGMSFPELPIIGKSIIIRFKSRGPPCYFLSSRSQKIENITKI